MLCHDDVEHVVFPFLLGHVCVQVDVYAVACFTRYGGHKSGRFFPVSGWVSYRLFCVFLLFIYELLVIDVLAVSFYWDQVWFVFFWRFYSINFVIVIIIVLILLIIRFSLRCWFEFHLMCWLCWFGSKNGGGSFSGINFSLVQFLNSKFAPYYVLLDPFFPLVDYIYDQLWYRVLSPLAPFKYAPSFQIE